MYVPNGHCSNEMSVLIQAEFGGGAEILLEEKEKKEIQIEIREGSNIGDLIQDIARDRIKEEEKRRLFLSKDGKSVRPGILVLVNDVDWELCGETEYQLQKGDKITFISTLHGG